MSRAKPKTKVEADKEKWGSNDNTYSSPPDYYYDEEFQCADCGKKEVWKATDQKCWYEELGKTINSVARYCCVCRAHTKALKEEQKRHMEKMAKKPRHPNEEFFRNT